MSITEESGDLDRRKSVGGQESLCPFSSPHDKKELSLQGSKEYWRSREGLMAVLVRSPGCLVLLCADTAMCIIDAGETPCTLIATLPPPDEI